MNSRSPFSTTPTRATWRISCSVLLLAILNLPIARADPSATTDIVATKPIRSEIFRFVTVPGAIRANQQIAYFSRVSGYLKTLEVDKGDRVKAGQSLGEIEVPDLLAEDARLRAELAVAEADAKRVTEAQAKSKDLITPEAVDQAKGHLEVAKANLKRSETFLAYAHITAPFSGVITARFVDPGAFVPAATNGSAPQSAALFSLSDFSVVRAQVSLPENESSRVKVGQPVKVSVESLPGKTFEGKVSRFSYGLDETTRTMLVEADLPNDDLVLRPGMYASIKVGVERHENALLVPSNSLVMEKTNAFVFINQQGKAHRVAIKNGFNDGERTEVLGGISESDVVLVSKKAPLTEGQSITATP